MAREVTLSVAPLVDLCGRLGIEVSELAAVEDAEVLSYTFPVTSANAALLDAHYVTEFVAQYGTAAKISLRTGELVELEVAPGITEEAVSRFAESVRSGGPDNAMIYVDKAQLAERLAPPQQSRAIRVFLFAEALRRELARGIRRFEARVWNDAPALVITVLDADINLVGTHLTIIGGAFLTEAPTAASVPPPAEGFTTIIASRDQQVGWDMQWVQALTPWHFALTGTCDDAELMGLLRAQLAKLAILYTCDRARSRLERGSPKEILAEYRGRDHVAVIPIDERLPLSCSEPEISAVLRTVTWCYERHGGDGQPDWVSDRLPFVQTRVAQTLEPQPTRERFIAFVRAMPGMFDGIEWQWKAFVEGKVSEYLDRVQQVEAIVSETVVSFTERASSLVTALTQTVLAAVAVLIGSFIAAAFHSPFNTALFRIGVLSYAVYVVLFPGAVGLISSTSSLRTARSEFETRVGRFNQALYSGKVTEIVGTRVSAAQRSYYRWVAFVVIVYVAVVIAAGIAAVEVPHLVLHVHTGNH